MEVRKRRSRVSKILNRVDDDAIPSASHTQPNQTFVFSSDDASGGERTPRSGKVNFVATDLKKIKILIVDDERDLRDAVVFDFKKKGFSVFSAENGLKALEIINSESIDLIISDVRMPECDGLMLLERVMATDGKIPKIIFITAFTDLSEQELLARGAIKVFPKPFDRKKMMAFVLESIGVI